MSPNEQPAEGCGCGGERGSAIVEFAFMLPMLLLLLLGCADICLMLESKIRLTHLSREAANVYSRGATAAETLAGVVAADGDLALDGANGAVILTRVGSDQSGNPVIVDQQASGGLSATSSIGTLPPGGAPVPATLPNGRDLPPFTSLVIVEMFSVQFGKFIAPGIWDGEESLVMRSTAVF